MSESMCSLLSTVAGLRGGGCFNKVLTLFSTSVFYRISHRKINVCLHIAPRDKDSRAQSAPILLPYNLRSYGLTSTKFSTDTDDRSNLQPSGFLLKKKKKKSTAFGGGGVSFCGLAPAWRLHEALGCVPSFAKFRFIFQ